MINTAYNLFVMEVFFLQSIFLLRLKKHHVELNWLSYSILPLNFILNSFLNLVILPCPLPFTRLYSFLVIFKEQIFFH